MHIAISLFCQENLVPNGSFENGMNSWLRSGCAMGFENGATFDIAHDVLNPFITETGNIFYEPATVSCDIPTNYFGSQSPSDGNKYAGLWSWNDYQGGAGWDQIKSFPWLGIQLPTNFEKNVEYMVKFNVSKMENSNRTPSFKVYFSKDKSDYSNTPKDKWEIKDKTYVTSTSEWLTITINCTPDEDGYKYLWFKICSYSTLPMNNNHCGFYIDAVQVYEKCIYENPCKRTIGKIAPIRINTDGSFCYFENLDNVFQVSNIKIYNSAGQHVATEEDIYSVNGITEPFYISDHELVHGVYRIEMDLYNDCYYENKSFSFNKFDDFDTYTHPTYTDILIPRPCCSEEPNVIISNGVLYGHFPVVAVNNISTNGNVTISSITHNYSFTAGNSIKLNQGFKIEEGAEFSATIQSCNPDKLIANKNGLNDNDALNEFQDCSNNEAVNITTVPFENLLDINYSIYPNPNNGIFSIQIQNLENERSVNIELYNLNGSRIINKQSISKDKINIDLTDYRKGVYILKLIVGSKYITEKMIFE